MAILFRAVQAVIAATSNGPVSLDELAARYGSDKWGALRFYTPHYANHFGPLRHEPVRILEIGIGGYDSETLGASRSTCGSGTSRAAWSTVSASSPSPV
ncbi:hypothetical protein [Streptomyces sp. NPDC001410]|uniref:hypothetical protein n=1 Tax=Streptomyces sp. NPDC001410 TaxID=3364574 RepID=UPI0036B0B741